MRTRPATIQFSALLLVLSCASAPPPRSPAPVQPAPLDQRLIDAKARLAAEEIARADLNYGGYAILIETAVEAGLVTMRPAMEAELGRELTRTEDAQLEGVLDTTMKDVFPEDLWVREFASLYLRLFSPGDLEAIADFYRTPAGRHLNQLQAVISKEGEALGERLFEEHEAAFEKAFVAELAAAFDFPEEGSEDEAGTRALTIAEAIQACENIQGSTELPIACGTEYIDGRPAMMMGFANLASASEWWEPVSDRVAKPFCQATNAVNRQAFVMITLIDPSVARVYSCENDQWSEWTALDDD